MVSGSPASGQPYGTDAPTPADQIKERLQETAGQVVDQTQEKAGQLLDAAKQQTTSRLEAQKNQAADSLYKVAHALRQTAEGLRDQDEGGIATLAERAAHQAERGSGYLHARDLLQILDETEQLGRTHPLLFVGGALTLGLLGVRFLKSSRRAQQVSAPPVTPLLPAAPRMAPPQGTRAAPLAPPRPPVTPPPPAPFNSVSPIPPLPRPASAPGAPGRRPDGSASSVDTVRDRSRDGAERGQPIQGLPEERRDTTSGV